MKEETPTPDLSNKTIDNPNPFEKECQAIYNQAIDHACDIVRQYYVYGITEKIINSINSLKK